MKKIKIIRNSVTFYQHLSFYCNISNVKGFNNFTLRGHHFFHWMNSFLNTFLGFLFFWNYHYQYRNLLSKNTKLIFKIISLKPYILCFRRGVILMVFLHTAQYIINASTFPAISETRMSIQKSTQQYFHFVFLLELLSVVFARAACCTHCVGQALLPWLDRRTEKSSLLGQKPQAPCHRRPFKAHLPHITFNPEGLHVTFGLCHAGEEKHVPMSRFYLCSSQLYFSLFFFFEQQSDLTTCRSEQAPVLF